MHKRTFLAFQGILFAMAAIFFIIIMFLMETSDDDFKYFFVIPMTFVFGFMAFGKFKQFQKTGEEKKVSFAGWYAPTANATVEQRANFYKGFFWLTLGAFSLLTLITIWDLNDLETGAVAQVSVWWPIAFLYSNFGYWATVLSIPVLGMIGAGIFFWHWRKHLKLIPKTFFAIGYWYSEDESYYCKPKALVDAKWDEQEKQAVIAHIQQAETVVYYRGFSECRVCKKMNGSNEKSDGLFYFPDGFKHYLEAHQVKPPQLFIDFALGKNVRRQLEREVRNARKLFNGPSSYLRDFDSYRVDHSWWLMIGNSKT
ncbi:MAG: hypothetical protein IPH04_12220 [Saprospirales bacterium]|nr:hypothetical protein [Saprospirales bacterium]